MALIAFCTLIGCTDMLTLWDKNRTAFPDEIVLYAPDTEIETTPLAITNMQWVETETPILTETITASESVAETILEVIPVAESIPASDAVPDTTAVQPPSLEDTTETVPIPEDIPETELLPETMTETETAPVTIPEPETTPETTAEQVSAVASAPDVVIETGSETTATESEEESGSSLRNRVTIPDAEEEGDDLVWVPVNGGTKYHKSASCSKMKNPMQVTRETAIANGYEPCKRCYKKEK